MEALAIVISIFSLIIGSIAYIRIGRLDICVVERAFSEKIDELGALIHRTEDCLAVIVRASYRRSIRAIDEMASLVKELSETAVEEIREDLKAISGTLDTLSARAAREIKEVKAGMPAATVEAEEELSSAVEDAMARVTVIEARHQLALARLAAASNDLADAESRVDAAMSSFKTAAS